MTQFNLERVDTVALVTMDDGTGKARPNVLARAALESLARLMPELEEGDFSALVITGKPGSFSAGADLNEFPLIERREQAIEGSRTGHDLFGRIRALPVPDRGSPQWGHPRRWSRVGAALRLPRDRRRRAPLRVAGMPAGIRPCLGSDPARAAARGAGSRRQADSPQPIAAEQDADGAASARAWLCRSCRRAGAARRGGDLDRRGRARAGGRGPVRDRRGRRARDDGNSTTCCTARLPPPTERST